MIIDSEALHNAAVSASVAQHGVIVSDALFDEFMGTPDEVLLDRINRHYLAGRGTVTVLLADKQAAY